MTFDQSVKEKKRQGFEVGEKKRLQVDLEKSSEVYGETWIFALIKSK